eukprot:TRINITY_DN5602_c0_g1_i2.p1 TRINITY_DN5602_c0_g1~~TRINITY_DN5602_c0_g1_i2.p1  ORF type:complete len:105 (+),score=9.51 TRINITY_DN5602_c0_g1_i2:714-1028(+)
MKRHPGSFFLWVDFSKAFDSIVHNYLFNIALDVFNTMILQALHPSIIYILEHLILSLMYCDDTVICVNKGEVLLKAVEILDVFARISGLHVPYSALIPLLPGCA